jgi:hypothetical protein
MDSIFASDAHLLIFFLISMPRFLDDFPEQKLYDSICNGQWIYKSPFWLRISFHKHIGPPGRLIAKNIRQQGNAEKAFILVLA